MQNRFIVICLIFLCSTFFDSNSEAISRETIASWGLGVFPEKQQNALEEYFATIGFSVNSAQNAQIKNRNNYILKNNKCISKLAADFYSTLAVEAISNEKFLKAYFNIGDINLPMSKTIRDVGFEPGQVWEMAKKFSKGDNNLAIALIGMCGHDDTNTTMQFDKPSEEIFNKNSEKFKSYSANRSKVISQFCVFNYKSWDFENPNSCKSKLENFASGYWKLTDGAGQCPHLSPLFYPQSLGANVDISDQLKTKIAKYQAPNGGKKLLPAKYYHTLGSAYTSCILAKGGIPKLIAKKIVQKAINSYRTGRLCSAMEGFNNSDPSKLPSTDQVMKMVNHAKTSGDESLHPFMTDVPFLTDWDVTKEIVEDKLDRAKTRYDAVQLYRNSWTNTFSGCGDLQLFDATKTYFQKHGSYGTSNPCPRDWEKSRCQKVRDMMATWALDFEWSEAQHLAGLEFAYQNCTPDNENKDIGQRACEALKLTDTDREQSIKQ